MQTHWFASSDHMQVLEALCTARLLRKDSFLKFSPTLSPFNRFFFVATLTRNFACEKQLLRCPPESYTAMQEDAAQQ